MPRITLKAARINCGLTQEEMARKLGVSRESLLAWETGKVNIKPHHLMAYAQVTGFSVDDFLLPEKSILSGQKEGA